MEFLLISAAECYWRLSLAEARWLAVDAYLDLFDRLNRLGITSPDNIPAVCAKQATDVSEVVTDFFMERTNDITHQFGVTGGNRFVFYDADQNVVPVAKKALLYSESVLFVSACSLCSTISYSLADSDGETLSSTDYSLVGPEFVADLFALKPLLLEGVASLLPARVHRDIGSGESGWVGGMQRYMSASGNDDPVDWRTPVLLGPEAEARAVRLESSAQGALHVLAGQEHVRAQLLESDSQSGMAVRLFLPHLREVPLDLLLRLRRDEGDAFIRFQHALRKFFATDPGSDGSHRFLEMLEEVDHEIRVLGQRLESIRRKTRSEVAGFGLTSLGLLALYTLPDETAKLISQVLGISAIPAALKYIAAGEWSSQRLAESDFYYAWRLATEGR